MTSMVTVFRDKYVRGWPHDKGNPGRGRLWPLSGPDVPLEEQFGTDAHFAAYASPNGFRLRKAALDAGLVVTMTALVFDVDCPLVHGKPEPAPESWCIEMRAKARDLAEVHPDPFYYETRGGARIVYRYQDTLRSQRDAEEWAAAYNAVCAYLQRAFGIVADLACSDWTRLFRLPRATRDGELQNLPVGHGWAGAIGTFDTSQVTDEDFACASTNPDGTRAKVFRRAERRDFAPFAGTGDGRLFELLKARGDVVGTHAQGWLIRCPNEREHTGGRTGDDSTLLYPPASGKPLGAVHCKHAHCAGFTQQDWVQRLEREAGLRVRMLPNAANGLDATRRASHVLPNDGA